MASWITRKRFLCDLFGTVLGNPVGMNPVFIKHMIYEFSVARFKQFQIKVLIHRIFKIRINIRSFQVCLFFKTKKAWL